MRLVFQICSLFFLSVFSGTEHDFFSFFFLFLVLWFIRFLGNLGKLSKKMQRILELWDMFQICYLFFLSVFLGIEEWEFFSLFFLPVFGFMVHSIFGKFRNKQEKCNAFLKYETRKCFGFSFLSVWAQTSTWQDDLNNFYQVVWLYDALTS